MERVLFKQIIEYYLNNNNNDLIFTFSNGHKIEGTIFNLENNLQEDFIIINSSGKNIFLVYEYIVSVEPFDFDKWKMDNIYDG